MTPRDVRKFWRPGRRAVATFFIALTLTLVLTGEAAPTKGLPCSDSPLVDREFRDAALAELTSFVIRAPGLSADGAIRASRGIGYVDPAGDGWHYVSAYNVNLALVSALRVAPGQVRPIARDWLQWQQRHMAQTAPGEGIVFDYWVREKDKTEALCPPGIPSEKCPNVDAYDSTAATFLLLADAFVEADGDVELLRTRPMQQALANSAATLMALTQANGLTWAKPEYRIVYLMDNLEVAAGWRAWARVQRVVFGEMWASLQSERMASRIDDALWREFWDPSNGGTWRVSLGDQHDPYARWYPDTMAQAWPLLWGVSFNSRNKDRTQLAWRQAERHWREQNRDWATQTVDPAGFMWPAAAVAAQCMGELERAKTWVARARAQWMRPDDAFAWPFQVGDLYWLFWLAAPTVSKLEVLPRQAEK